MRPLFGQGKEREFLPRPEFPYCSSCIHTCCFSSTHCGFSASLFCSYPWSYLPELPGTQILEGGGRREAEAQLYSLVGGDGLQGSRLQCLGEVPAQEKGACSQC